MDVVCYGHPTDELFRDTWGRLQNACTVLGLELHESLDSFTARLRQPGRNIGVAMLYIADQKTGSDLLAVRHLLNDLPVVILLKDQEPDILQFSHELRPRVIIYTCWTAKDICSVLQRCITRYGHREEARTSAAGNARPMMTGQIKEGEGCGS